MCKDCERIDKNGSKETMLEVVNEASIALLEVSRMYGIEVMVTPTDKENEVQGLAFATAHPEQARVILKFIRELVEKQPERYGKDALFTTKGKDGKFKDFERVPNEKVGDYKPSARPTVEVGDPSSAEAWKRVTEEFGT